MERPHLTDLLSSFRKQKIVVLGDFYLDTYVHTVVAGVSPEKPVLRLLEDTSEHAAGAAGNIAVNLAALGAKVMAVGVIGNDAAGEQLVRALKSQQIDTTGLFVSPERVTGTLTRFLARTGDAEPQHLIRVDRENDRSIPGDVLKKIDDLLSHELPRSTGLFIADYDESPKATGLFGTGIISSAIKQANQCGIVSIATSRLNSSRLSDLTYLVCNELEVRLAGLSSADTIEKFSSDIVQRLRLTGICVTLGEDGVFGYSKSQTARSVSKQKVVADTCGAGDTFGATFLLSVLSGKAFDTSLDVATLAAGIAVTKQGTQPVGVSDLFATQDVDRVSDKFLDSSQLQGELDRLRATRKIVFTNGYFDLFHSGHVRFLQEARSLGDVLVVGINSDRSTRANKGPRRPVQKEMERVAILSALPSVDYVTVFDELTPINLLRAVKPHILVKGGNYTADEVIGRDLVEQAGGRVVIIPYQGEVTTKSMIDSVKDASDGFRNE